MRRRRPGPRFDPAGTLIILLAFAVFGYTGWTLLTAAPPVASLLVRATATRGPLRTPTPTATTTPRPTPRPTLASATPTAAAPRYVLVANTGGQGVYLRRTTNLDDRWLPWPDKTRLEVLDDAVQAAGIAWYKVKDPRGNEGFVPAEFVQPADG